MRIFQIDTFHDQFLDEFYLKNSQLALKPFAVQNDFLLRSGMSAGHLLTPYFSLIGHESFTCIANCAPLQKAWLLENVSAHKREENYDFRQVALMQVEAFRPDILYVTNPCFFDTSALKALSFRPRLCIGWRAAPTAIGVDFSGFDLMLTSDDYFKATCEQHGAQRVEFYYPGHPVWINEKLGSREILFDVVFSGQVGFLHQRRVQALESILPALRAHGLRVGLFALGQFSESSALNALNRGAVFGLDMYRVLHQSRITLNIVIDSAHAGGIKMRHLEATGVGSLIVDYGSTSNPIFLAGEEIFCSGRIGNAIDLILNLAGSDDVVEEMASRGQRKCLSEYEMNKRAELFLDICETMGNSHSY